MSNYLARTLTALQSAAFAFALLLIPANAEAQNIGDSGTALNVTFSNVDASMAILHYVLNGAGQQNVTMAQSGSQFVYNIPVTAGAAESLSYWFTYQVNGVQSDTGSYPWTRDAAGQTQVATPAFSLGSGNLHWHSDGGRFR